MMALRVLACVHAGPYAGKQIGCNCEAKMQLKVYQCSLLRETTERQCRACKEFVNKREVD